MLSLVTVLNAGDLDQTTVCIELTEIDYCVVVPEAEEEEAWYCEGGNQLETRSGSYKESD